MSRVMSKESVTEKEYEDTPAIQLLPEDNQEILEAVEKLNSIISLLYAKAIISESLANKMLNQITDNLAAANKQILEQISKPSKSKEWVFTIKRDRYGELSSVIAKEVAG